jgi:hypothetical protein
MDNRDNKEKMNNRRKYLYWKQEDRREDTCISYIRYGMEEGERKR